ncbi:unnamed protein product [Adineta steineri]|uniref:NHL repeat containing protein-like protein n=2 Tax=Adineta steineri TaxID=433720 RepID=A0A819B6F1_9BILA|nr:unnamed protein product [Adineta steineri]CAF3796367.1 unnamed protein product [Adineta steineri]
MPVRIIPKSARIDHKKIARQELRSVCSAKNPIRPKVRRLSRDDLRSLCRSTTSSRAEIKHVSHDDLKSIDNNKRISIRKNQVLPKSEDNSQTKKDESSKITEQPKKRSFYQRKGGILFKIGVVAVILLLIGAVIFLLIKTLQSNTSSSNANTNSNTTTSIINITTPTSSISSTTTATFLYRWNVTGTTVAGTGSSITTAAADQLDHPFSLALDSSNILYIADQQNNRIQKWILGAMTGTTIAGDSGGIAGTNSTEFYQPSGIVLDSSGGIYITDTSNNRVQYWSNGAVSGTTVAGIQGSTGSANNLLVDPFGIALDSSSGTLYIVDQSNSRVMSYLSGAPSGTVVAGGNGLGTGSTQLNYPVGLYFDSSSNSLIIANAGSNNIVRWVIGATNWVLVAGSSTGTSGSSSELLNYPVGVTLDSLGNLYVADRDNHRIQLFLAGQTNGTTIVGVSGQSGSNNTFLYKPCAVILDSQRNLYVADTYNNRVQQFIRY